MVIAHAPRWSKVATVALSVVLLSVGITTVLAAADPSANSAVSSGGMAPVDRLLPDAQLAAYPRVALPDPSDLLDRLHAVPAGPSHLDSTQVVLTLAAVNESRLGRLLASLNDPSSPNYHHFLTATEFDQNFSPPTSTVDSLVGFLTASGAQRVTTSTDRLTITFDASSQTVERVFGTSLENYREGTGTFYAPLGAPTLPAPLASAILEVGGLSTSPATVLHTDLVSSVHPAHHFRNPTPVTDRTAPGSDYLPPPTIAGTQFEYAPDFQVAYDEQSLFDRYGFPTGAVVATILWSGEYTGNTTMTPYGPLAKDSLVGPFVPGDISSFFNQTIPAGEPKPRALSVPLLGAPAAGPLAAWDSTQTYFENTLDLEMVGSTAPGASIYNVYGPSASTVDVDAAFSYILNPNASFAVLRNVSAISNSWGGPDANDSAWFQDLEEAQIRGITVLASSGDSGDSTSSSKYVGGPGFTEFPSSVATNSVGVVAVGGTTVTLASSLHLATNIAWMEFGAPGGPYGSTGGVSTMFPEPDWQRTSEANEVIAGAGRGVPDLAAIANNTLVTISVQSYRYNATNASDGGGFYSLAGTSVASPLTAGLVAEVDHVLTVNHDTPLAFFDPAMYALANREFSPLVNSSSAGYLLSGPYAASLPTLPFLDVSQGANAVYAARPGYDLVTGWGSLDAYNFTMYVLSVPSVGVPGHLAGVRDVLNLTGLDVTTRYSNGTVALAANASVEENLFLANSLGAPVYWVHNLAELKSVPGGTWTVTGAAWTEFPFSGLYPTLTVREYNTSMSSQGTTLPTTLNLTTSVAVPSGPESAVMTFNLDGAVATIPVPGAAWVLGNLSTDYSWQGTNYSNGPLRNGTGLGMLAPQLAVLGGVPGGTATFSGATDGGVTASVLPFGATYVPAGSSVFLLNISQSSETAADLSWTTGGGAASSFVALAGATDQGVLTVEPASALATYPVTVTETGLPVGTTWRVSVTGGGTYSSSLSAIGFALPNGTYPYSLASSNPGYAPASSSGTISVQGEGTNVSVAFTPVRSSVTFEAAGLPANTTWSVTLAGVSNQSSGPTIGFEEETGTYPYVIPPVLGFTSNENRGNVSVAGSSVVVLVPFSSVVYSVTFTANGLPAGAEWSVTVAGVERSSASPTITFTEPNGSYSYSIGAPVGYSAHAFPTTVVVNGGNVDVTVTLSTAGAGSGGSVLGLTLVELAVAAAVVLGLAVGIIAAVAWRRRRRPDPEVRDHQRPT